MKSRIQLLALFVGLLVIPTNGLLAQATAVQENIDYKTIIAEYLEATGGEMAHKGVKSVEVKGTMSIPAMGIEGKLHSVMNEKNSYTKVEFPGIGAEVMGHDGETVWKISDMTGPEIIDDERKTMMLRSSKLSSMMTLADDYESIECTGTEEFNGEECYVVELKNEDEKPTYYYFSVESKLQVGTKLTQVDPNMGEMEIVSKMSDYKDVDGVKVAHATTAELPTGITMVTEVETYTVNGEIDEALFEFPAEIKELIEDDK